MINQRQSEREPRLQQWHRQSGAIRSNHDQSEAIRERASPAAVAPASTSWARATQPRAASARALRTTRGASPTCMRSQGTRSRSGRWQGATLKEEELARASTRRRPLTCESLNVFRPCGSIRSNQKQSEAIRSNQKRSRVEVELESLPAVRVELRLDLEAEHLRKAVEGRSRSVQARWKLVEGAGSELRSRGDLEAISRRRTCCRPLPRSVLMRLSVEPCSAIVERSSSSASPRMPGGAAPSETT